MSDAIPEEVRVNFNDLSLPVQAHIVFDAALDVVRSIGTVVAAFKEGDDAWLRSSLKDCAAAVGRLTDRTLVAWICRYSERIDQARTAPFHWTPLPGEPHLSWTPALYAVLSHCEEVIRPLLEGAGGEGRLPQVINLDSFSEGFLATELSFERGKFAPWFTPVAKQPEPVKELLGGGVPAPAWKFSDERGLIDTERAILNVLRAANEALQAPQIKRRLERLNPPVLIEIERVKTLLRPGYPLRNGFWIVHVKGDGYRPGPR
jgi:hypothetical protein